MSDEEDVIDAMARVIDPHCFDRRGLNPWANAYDQRTFLNDERRRSRAKKIALRLRDAGFGRVREAFEIK